MSNKSWAKGLDKARDYSLGGVEPTTTRGEWVYDPVSRTNTFISPSSSPPPFSEHTGIYTIDTAATDHSLMEAMYQENNRLKDQVANLKDKIKQQRTSLDGLNNFVKKWASDYKKEEEKD